MGRGIIIMEPRRISRATSDRGTGVDRLLTPNPKEAFDSGRIAGGDQASAYVDLFFFFDTPTNIDTFYLGYIYGSNAARIQLYDRSGSSADYLGQADMMFPDTPPGHIVLFLDQPRTVTFINVRVFTAQMQPAVDAVLSIGVAAAGLRFQTEYGEERGGGGLIEDTGSVERLFGGGFGIDEGVATTGYQWTFGDLQDAERRQLFQIVKRLRTTRSFLMVENPAQTEGLNERIHWGLFRKLEAYERIDPRNSKWALSLWDWA